MDQKENLSHILRGKGFQVLLAAYCHCSPFTCKGAWTRSTTADQEWHIHSRRWIFSVMPSDTRASLSTATALHNGSLW